MNISKAILRIIVLTSIILLILSVDPLIDWLYQLKFNTKILPINPAADFNLYYDAARISTDKKVLYADFGFISFMLLIFLNSQEKLINLKKASQNPPRNELFKIFVIRLFVYFSILAGIFFTYVVFEDVFAKFDTSSNIFVAGVILLIVNLVIIAPYIITIGIYDGFDILTFIKFSLTITVILGICMAIGISGYFGGAIAASVGSLSTGKKIAADFKKFDAFFGIQGKNIFEMFR